MQIKPLQESENEQLKQLAIDLDNAYKHLEELQSKAANMSRQDTALSDALLAHLGLSKEYTYAIYSKVSLIATGKIVDAFIWDYFKSDLDGDIRRESDILVTVQCVKDGKYTVKEKYYPLYMEFKRIPTQEETLANDLS